MGKTIKAIRRGIKAGVNAMQNPQHDHFQAGGKTIVCSDCGNDSFDYLGVAGITIGGYGIACPGHQRLKSAVMFQMTGASILMVPALGQLCRGGPA